MLVCVCVLLYVETLKETFSSFVSCLGNLLDPLGESTVRNHWLLWSVSRRRRSKRRKKGLIFLVNLTEEWNFSSFLLPLKAFLSCWARRTIEFELLQGWRAPDSILLFNNALENLAVFDRCLLFEEYQWIRTDYRLVQVNQIDRHFSMAIGDEAMFVRSSRSRRSHLHRWSQLEQYPVIVDGAAPYQHWSHAYASPVLTMNFPGKKKKKRWW